MLSSIALVAALNLPRAPQPRLQVPSTASARPIYDTSSPWDPRICGDANSALGNLLEEWQDLDGAEKAYRKAIEFADLQLPMSETCRTVRKLVFFIRFLNILTRRRKGISQKV